MFRQDQGHSQGPKRRDLLRAGTLAALPLGVPALAASTSGRSVIFVMMVGGPSQLDTFDPKPDAPREIRGPFGAIRTAADGVQVSDLLPLLARQANHFSLVRTLHHAGSAVHDAGHHLMQTGRPFAGEREEPSIGSVASQLLGSRDGMPAHVLLPERIGPTGGNMPHGDGAAWLNARHEPFVFAGDPGTLPERAYLASLSGAASAAAFDRERLRAAYDLRREPESVQERYGRHKFGRSCLLARRLVEAGVRFVTVNQFSTVFDAVSWDAHGAAPFSAISDIRDAVAPAFDQAMSALFEDLAARGLLSSTLVAATGEFGRTPRINPAGGRDHWTNCYSALLGGGGLRGGITVGESDARAAEPKERPVSPAEFAATIYHSLGISPSAEAAPGVRVVDSGVSPIRELIG